MPRLLSLFIVCLLVGATSFAGANDAKITLKTAGHDAYPKFYYEKDQSGERSIAGMGVDILRAIEVTDPDLKFEIYPELVPWRRLQNQIKTGEVDFFVGLVNNEKRRKIYNMVDTALYQLNHVVAVRREAVFDIHSFDDFVKLGADGAIVTLAGSGTVNYMKKKNPDLIILDQAKSIQHGLELIMRGRANFFYYHDLAIKSAILANDLQKQVKILPATFRDYSQYAAISKALAPEIAQRLKKAVQTMSENGTLDRIFSKYTNRTSAKKHISGDFKVETLR